MALTATATKYTRQYVIRKYKPVVISVFPRKSNLKGRFSRKIFSFYWFIGQFFCAYITGKKY